MNPAPTSLFSAGPGLSRRAFLRSTLGATAAAALGAPASAARASAPLAGEVGITTGSFMRHLSATAAPGKLRLLDLPKIMRDELGMTVIDLMTATLAAMTPAYLDELRAAAADAGCVLTNLKMNNPGLDLGSPDEAKRRHALAEYKQTMDAAARLGVRWVRPLPGVRREDLARIAGSYRELIDYGANRGLSLLIENIGWIKDDADAIPAIVAAVGPGLRAQPDTGNWADAVRFAGLAKAFPLAVTCDFKAFALEADGGHKAYDLQRCFQAGWDAGFRGPWCLEHFHENLRELVREMGWLRDRLKEWTRAAPTP